MIARTDPRWAHYAKHSATLAYMIKHGLPLTRSEWVKLNYPDGVPNPWTVEHELEVPEPFRDHSKLRDN